MKWLGLLAISAATYASSVSVRVAAQAHIRCQNTIGGPCGDSSRPREYNCCDYGYCQPWNSGYYQCLNKPDKCPTQETDIDYAGNDLKTIRGILPDKCCEECSNTAGCTVYTFVNQNPDGKSACYLKKSAAGRVEKKGAVSGVLAVVPPPANCPEQETGVDYYGNDLKSLFAITQTACCDECSKLTGCVAYTFVEKNADGKTACYLKSSTAGKVAKAGAVSGKVKDPVTTPPPPPPENCPVQEADVDYYGNDLKTLNGVTQTECCDACGKTDKCVGYSFVAKGWDGKSACYLKSSAAGKVAKTGVISGKLKDPVTTPPPPPPANCPVQEIDVDYYGNDLKTVYALTQGGCCDECTKTPGCMGYTFVAKGPDGRTACYLKGSTTGKVAKVGAVSGAPLNILPPANCPSPMKDTEFLGFDLTGFGGLTYGECCEACGRTSGCAVAVFKDTTIAGGVSSCILKKLAYRYRTMPGAISIFYNCPTPVFGTCGSAATGPLCCPSGSYCQPWNSKYYQCVPPPDTAKCHTVLTNVDFYGGDIETKYGLQPGECCEACFNNKDCTVYTFVNENPDGKTACYLKSKVVEQRAKVGAVSGYKVIQT